MAESEGQYGRVDDGFLSRWSERKLALRDGIATDDGSPEEASSGQQDSRDDDDAGSSSEPAAALTDADMPSVEDLDAESDYSGFLSQGVSESLRNQALKKLFFSGRFNIVDGLDDYAEDFTQFAALGGIVTAEMRHRIDEAAKRIAVDADRDASCEGAAEPTVAAAADARAAGHDDNVPESTTTDTTDIEGQEEQ